MEHNGRVPAMLWMAAVFLITFAASAQPIELMVPDDLFFYRPVASAYGQSTVWSNPAGLANKQLGSMLVFTQRNQRVIQDYGASATTKMLAIAYRHLDNDQSSDLDEYVLAIGGGRRLKIGLSYRYIKNGPGYLNNRHTWNLAVLAQRTKNLSMGARFENLNRGRVEGERTDIRLVYGAAARVYRDIVTVSFDVDMTRKENLDAADFRTGIEVRPIPGMYLYADFDNHSRFNLGFRLNFGSAYVGHYHNFDRDGKSYLGTTYTGSVKGKQPSLIKPRRKSLTLKLDGTLPENPKIPVFGKKPLKYFDYIDVIYRAAADDEIDRIFLDIGTLKCGLGKVEELTGAVEYFKSRGKRVYAFVATPNNLGYLLACTADKVIIPPVSQLNLIGLRANLMTVKGLLDKIGIEAEIERIEEYKTAPEMYMFDRPSEPCREQINRILDNLYSEMVMTIAAHRNLTADSVKILIDSAPLTSVDAVEYGLVDGLSYHEEALKEYAGSSVPWLSRRVSLRKYLGRAVYHDRWGVPPRLALVIADGSMTAGKSGGRVGDYEMLGAIKKARDDPSVKGVVLRVNSPGGTVLASDLIWHEIEKTVAKKPVVISMGNVAASGGYYISSVKSEILVNRSTITGSIGVYGGKANISELLDKIGVYTESYSRGRNANIYSLYESFTDDQRRQLKSQMRRFYHHFTEKVGEARALSPDSVDKIGRGRVWTGEEAVANGLADRIGGFYQALETLYTRSGVERGYADIVTFPRERYYFRNPFDFPRLYGKLSALLTGDEESLAALNIFESDHIFYRMPYDIEIE
jgi:protease-4